MKLQTMRCACGREELVGENVASVTCSVCVTKVGIVIDNRVVPPDHGGYTYTPNRPIGLEPEATPEVLAKGVWIAPTPTQTLAEEKS